MIDNVLTVSIGNSRKITTRPAWLTDKGMILKFVGVDLPVTYLVDFANNTETAAIQMIGDEDGVEIPSQLFHNAEKILAWLRFTPSGDVHFTVYQITIPLQVRSEISNVQPTPEQEDIIDQSIAALNDAIEETGRSEAAAAASAANAADSAVAALAYEREAAGSAGAASESAIAAAGSAANALASQNAAGLSEINAAASEANAENAAERAEQAAAQAGYMFFYIDDNGDLIYQRTENVSVDFYLNEGDLFVKAVS